MSKTLALKQSRMANWLFHLDQILRGEATKPSEIRNQADIQIPVFGVALIVCLLAVIYGFCMGVFALVRGFENAAYQQAVLQTFASMCKVPLLFFLTLVVTFPSLYVFNALVGSQLRLMAVLKLLVASLAVNLAVLASMGPILAFFSVSTPNYSFIVLLNVVVFAIAGALGLVFLVQTLNRLTLANRGQLLPSRKPDRADATRPASIAVNRPKTQALENAIDKTMSAADRDAPIVEAEAVAFTKAESGSPFQTSRSDDRPGPLDQLGGVVFGNHVRQVFFCWIVVFGLVGAQMGWVLRPFIGSPNTPFTWFRPRSSNFFEAVANTIQNLF